MIATLQQRRRHATVAAAADTEDDSGDDDDDDDESVAWTCSAAAHCAAGVSFGGGGGGGGGASKPYFVYLMASITPPTKVRRLFTHIGKSREPVRKVLRHNEGRVNSGKRSTRPVAPNWRLEELIGPFDTRREARHFQKCWFRNTKGVKQRIERGVKLANEHNRVCYTPRAVLNGGGAILHGDNRMNDPLAKMRAEAERLRQSIASAEQDKLLMPPPPPPSPPPPHHIDEHVEAAEKKRKITNEGGSSSSVKEQIEKLGLHSAEFYAAAQQAQARKMAEEKVLKRRLQLIHNYIMAKCSADVEDSSSSVLIPEILLNEDVRAALRVQNITVSATRTEAQCYCGEDECQQDPGVCEPAGYYISWQ